MKLPQFKSAVGALCIGVYIIFAFIIWPLLHLFGNTAGTHWVYLWMTLLDNTFGSSGSNASFIANTLGFALNLVTVYWIGVGIEKIFVTAQKPQQPR